MISCSPFTCQEFCWHNHGWPVAASKCHTVWHLDGQVPRSSGAQHQEVDDHSQKHPLTDSLLHVLKHMGKKNTSGGEKIHLCDIWKELFHCNPAQPQNPPINSFAPQEQFKHFQTDDYCLLMKKEEGSTKLRPDSVCTAFSCCCDSSDYKWNPSKSKWHPNQAPGLRNPFPITF